MGTVMWGTDEHLECITALPHKLGVEPLEIGGQNNVCIGFKFSVSWAGIPYSTTDDGYVLTVRDSKQYIPLDKDGIAELQAEGLVTTPAPTYSIPAGWVYAQYSMHVLIGIIVLAVGFKFWLRRRLANRRTSGEIASGPVLRKKKDRALLAMLSPMLAVDETISHQAYAHSEDMSDAGIGVAATNYAFFIALTNKRLIWIQQKAGVLGIGKGDQTTDEIDRATIGRIDTDKNGLDVRRTDGAPLLTIYVPLAGSGYSFENQSAFLADLPRMFGV
jgi:hypothetical protein